MNLESMPQTMLIDTQTGQMNDTWKNFFSINSQNMTWYFSNVGHAVPQRSDDEITALSTTDNMTRYLYNSTTDSPMTNVAGSYRNITTTMFMTPEKLSSYSPSLRRLDVIATTDGGIFVTVNGQLHRILTERIL